MHNIVFGNFVDRYVFVVFFCMGKYFEYPCAKLWLVFLSISVTCIASWSKFCSLCICLVLILLFRDGFCFFVVFAFFSGAFSLKSICFVQCIFFFFHFIPLQSQHCCCMKLQKLITCNTKTTNHKLDTVRMNYLQTSDLNIHSLIADTSSLCSCIIITPVYYNITVEYQLFDQCTPKLTRLFTNEDTLEPTQIPTTFPTMVPTSPTNSPTNLPISDPTSTPSHPSIHPTTIPTDATDAPTATTMYPTISPTAPSITEIESTANNINDNASGGGLIDDYNMAAVIGMTVFFCLNVMHCICLILDC